VITTWTIYDHPRDAPLGYVLRAWHGAEPHPLSSGSADLELLRDTLPPGLVCLGRWPGDDPAILEVWI